jgi:glucosamine-6-phosphate deaminase
MPVEKRRAYPAKGASAKSRELVPVLVFDDSTELAIQVARRIRSVMEARNAVGEMAVLGLPTGSTPLGVYHELIRMHREDGLDFSHVVTFNLDEYFPIQPDSLQSYHRFMRENLFEHVNIPADQIHIPDGNIDPSTIDAHCMNYERLIKDAGGIDLMILGIGRSGHIGFNEPGSKPDDRTRLITLDEITRKDAASDFFEERFVPREAITMGVGTILDAREIILIATGEHKGPIIRRAAEELPTESVPASFLQSHQNATFYLDRAAASELTREKTPWVVSPVEWTATMKKRAVIWLSEKVEKGIQQLDTSDFHRYHLHDLVYSIGNIDELCHDVFEDLRRRVLYRSQLPRDRNVIVFSPHPDDDVISMGGMLAKLVQNDNKVVVAYMTNGSVAVFDQDVRRHLRFVQMTQSVLDPKRENGIRERVEPIINALEEKSPAEPDSEQVQQIKASIRYSEAISALETIGLGLSHARFLDLPFYKTGRVRKDPIGEADIEIVLELLRAHKPYHIFVAGDLSDPHGTHRMCYSAIKEAYDRYVDEITTNAEEARKPMVWLYRGAWQEWDIDQTDVFLPLSKADLDRKIEAIFKHESQKDRALFPGAYDDREFWQRARDRNCDTAEALDALGLPEFYAVEAFVTAEELV